MKLAQKMEVSTRRYAGTRHATSEIIIFDGKVYLGRFTELIKLAKMAGIMHEADHALSIQST